MRKRILTPDSTETTVAGGPWLNLETEARVEVSSEEPTFPIENALLPGKQGGWRAAAPGKQTIHLLFDTPQRLQRIQVIFAEEEMARTQEFHLCWRSGVGEPPREILRQQYNFSPPYTTREEEDLGVNLENVAVLELTIIPEMSGGAAVASLASLRVG